MTIFDAKQQKSEVLVARERAPLSASQNMFNGNSSLAKKVFIII